MITYPGHGAPGKNCGDDVTYGCHDCGNAGEKDTYFSITSECMKKTCPDCYEKWALRQGAHAAERMTDFLNSPTYMRRLQDAERQRWQDALTDPEATREEKRLYRIQTYHISISFVDVEFHTREDIALLRKRAREIGRSHGLFGECTIPHQRTVDDPGAHFHFLALAGFIAPGGGDGSDYILEVIEHEGSWYPRSFLDRLNVVKYACTHATIEEQSHCVTWSGCVANNRFPGLAEVDHIPQQPMCPHCGGTWTFKVYDRDWYFHEDVETWTAPDRPPPGEPQRCVTEYT